MRRGHTQAIAQVCLITSKSLVNRHSNKVVNIASTKMMNGIFGLRESFPRATTGFGDCALMEPEVVKALISVIASQRVARCAPR